MTTVAVIGAGISGLVTARTLLSDGFDVTILERRRHIGGVWEPDVTYPGLTTQTTKDQYAISDHPMPEEWPDWPSAAQIYEYLVAYAEKWRLPELIRFGVTVEGLEQTGDGGWQVPITTEDGTETLTFDRVVVCAGVFSRPNVPEIPGHAEFEQSGGRVLHSSQVDREETLAGRQVVILGFQKSAADVAMLSVNGAEATTMVYRTPCGRCRDRRRSRPPAASAVLTAYPPHARPVRLARTAPPMHNPFVLAELADPGTGPAPAAQAGRPRSRAQAPDRHADRLLPLGGARPLLRAHPQRRAGARQSDTFALEDGHLITTSGERVPCDVLVLATGWRATPDLVGPPLLERLLDADGNFLLYRNVVLPGVEGLGFVGYNGGIFCQLTAEVAAAWLSSLWSGRFTLPGEAEQEKGWSTSDRLATPSPATGSGPQPQHVRGAVRVRLPGHPARRHRSLRTPLVEPSSGVGRTPQSGRLCSDPGAGPERARQRPSPRTSIRSRCFDRTVRVGESHVVGR